MHPSARARRLAAAEEPFYKEDVRRVGIDRIIEKAGVAKATLSRAFGSKEGLIRAYLHGPSPTARIGATGPRRDRLTRERILAVLGVLGRFWETGLAAGTVIR